MKKLLLLVFMPIYAHAFFCPNNFNQINLGDTIQTVTEKCGAPSQEKKSSMKKEGAQEWSYYSPTTLPTNRAETNIGTFKTTVAFNAEGKAVNISVNGIGTSETQLCGAPIKLGATREDIKKICGESSMISKSDANNSDASGAPGSGDIAVVDFVYQSNPPVTLHFENGVLKNKK